MVGKRTQVSSQNVFDLFLLETTFDNESACAIDTSSCTHFGEEELDNVFGLCITSQRCIPHQTKAAKELLTCLCIFLQISVTLAKIDFLFPSRNSCGGAMVYRFLEVAERREGLAAWREL